MRLFKPAWHGENKEKALKSIVKEKNQSKLVEIFRTAPLDDVRIAALNKLTDQNILADIAKDYIYQWEQDKPLDIYEQARMKAIKEDNEHCIRTTAADKLVDRTLAKQVYLDLLKQPLSESERDLLCTKAEGHFWDEYCKCSVCGTVEHIIENGYCTRCGGEIFEKTDHHTDSDNDKRTVTYTTGIRWPGKDKQDEILNSSWRYE